MVQKIIENSHEHIVKNHNILKIINSPAYFLGKLITRPKLVKISI